MNVISNNEKSVNRKSEVVLRLLRGESLEELCREYNISAADLSKWRDYFERGGKDSFRASPEDKRLQEAERVIGKQAMELEIYKKRWS